MYNPTNEQVIANEIVTSGSNLLIEAAAGSGKSSSLRYFAQQNPTKTFLALCFNKANADEANLHKDRPFNIYYATVHSLAYREVVIKQQMHHKVAAYFDYRDINRSKLQAMGLTDSAKDIKEEKEQLNTLCRTIQDCLTWYCRHDNSQILLEFAANYYANVFTLSETMLTNEIVVKNTYTLTEEQIIKLAEYTRAYWLVMIDPGSSIKITHDVYLKLFELRKHDITSFYDKTLKEYIQIGILCLDELQDSNPVTVSIFKNSTIGQKIVIGDRMQSIYQWRGATDAMNQFNEYKVAYLTESFRFPQEIADLANIVLKKAGSKMKIRGSGNFTETNCKAYLCRTNSEVLSIIWQNASKGKKIFTNIDLKDIFSKLYHLDAVLFEKEPKFPNKELKDIKTKEQLEDSMVICPEISNLMSIRYAIATAGGSLYKGIKLLEDTLVDKDKAEVIASTIHRSKGLEFNNVIIADDFIRYNPEKDDIDELVKGMWKDKTMCNLLYVGITRTMTSVKLPWYISNALNVTSSCYAVNDPNKLLKECLKENAISYLIKEKV
jgi:F-box protein 18 (helicase)